MVSKDSSTMNEHRISSDRDVADLNSEAAMDKYLKSIGLYRKPVAKDGSCLFRAVAEKVYKTQAKHVDVRHECIRYMKDNSDQFKEFVPGSFDHHLFNLQNPKEWAGQVEITALSMLYKHDIIVYQEVNQPPQNVTDNGFKEKIFLCFSNGNHYDCIYPQSFKDDAAIVQSILYDHLYNAILVECNKRDGSKARSNHTGAEMSADGNGWINVKQKAGTGKEDDKCPAESSGPTWEIQRSLDPNVYRNVALEVWEQSKKDQANSDRVFAVKLQFRIGEECLLQMPDAVSPHDAVKARIEGFADESGVYNVWVPDYQEHVSVSPECLGPILDRSEKHPQISYRDLPGYYKKPDDFQYPKTKKQKAKNTSSSRDEESKWRRLDLRNEAKNDTKIEGRMESKGEPVGHKRDIKKDRRSLQSGERGREERGEKQGEKKVKQNEKINRKKESQKLQPTSGLVKSESRAAPEARQESEPSEKDTVESVAVVATTDYPSLRTQEKEKTAKHDESPAAFWHRMNKIVKPASTENDSAKKTNRETTTKTTTDKHLAMKEEGVCSGGESLKLRPDRTDEKTVDRSPEASESGAHDTCESTVPMDSNSSRTADQTQTQNSATITKVKNKDHGKRRDTQEVSSDEKPVGTKTEISHANLSKKLDEIPAGDMGILSGIQKDGQVVASSSAVQENIKRENSSTAGKILSQDSQKEEGIDEESGETQKKQSTARISQTNKKESETHCMSPDSRNIATDAKDSSACLHGNMVSFPTGFDEPIVPQTGNFSAIYQSDLASSESPLTFMSSHSDISLSADEGGVDANLTSAADLERTGTGNDIGNDSPIETEIGQEKQDQKSEQRIRILRKDNKDQFVYFNPTNESNLSLDMSGSRSRERSPEPEAKKTQAKKVSFGEVTEILQATSEAESFTQSNAQSSIPDYLQSAYGNANGVTEHQDQIYFDEGRNYNPSAGMPTQVMPLMMHPLPHPTEQINFPQGYSVDPEGKDLPNHIPTVQYFFNLGLQFQYLQMQPQPHAFYNVPMSQVPTAALQIPPQPLQSQATTQLPQQRFQQQLDPSSQQFSPDQQEDFLAASPATPFQFDIMHQHQLNQIRQQQPSQNTASQYEQPPRMRRGRGRGSNVGPSMSFPRGYNVYNHSQQKQPQYRLSTRRFHVNTGHMGAPNQSYLYQ